MTSMIKYLFMIFMDNAGWHLEINFLSLNLWLWNDPLEVKNKNINKFLQINYSRVRQPNSVNSH